MAAASEGLAALGAAAGAIAGACGTLRSLQAVGGGCINDGYRLAAAGGDYFLKLNRNAPAALFEAEAAGLQQLAATGCLRVPRPVCWGDAERCAFLVLEWLDLRAGGPAADEQLGRQLAALHRQPQPYFGWHRDNHIGATPQPNAPADDWIGFWSRRRLGHQLDLAARRGYGGTLQRDGEELCRLLPGLFPGYRPQPALLHGDLWGGNWACVAGSVPVLFDPACYYGDREADVAMTELFGGFGNRFYAVYREAWPLDSGYRVRKQLYNLYHILNHLNLFGSAYLSRAQSMMAALLAELRA